MPMDDSPPLSVENYGAINDDMYIEPTSFSLRIMFANAWRGVTRLFAPRRSARISEEASLLVEELEDEDHYYMTSNRDALARQSDRLTRNEESDDGSDTEVDEEITSRLDDEQEFASSSRYLDAGRMNKILRDAQSRTDDRVNMAIANLPQSKNSKNRTPMDDQITDHRARVQGDEDARREIEADAFEYLDDANDDPIHGMTRKELAIGIELGLRPYTALGHNLDAYYRAPMEYLYALFCMLQNINGSLTCSEKLSCEHLKDVANRQDREYMKHIHKYGDSLDNLNMIFETVYINFFGVPADTTIWGNLCTVDWITPADKLLLSFVLRHSLHPSDTNNDEDPQPTSTMTAMSSTLNGKALRWAYDVRTDPMIPFWLIALIFTVTAHIVCLIIYFDDPAPYSMIAPTLPKLPWWVHLVPLCAELITCVLSVVSAYRLWSNNTKAPMHSRVMTRLVYAEARSASLLQILMSLPLVVVTFVTMIRQPNIMISFLLTVLLIGFHLWYLFKWRVPSHNEIEFLRPCAIGSAPTRRFMHRHQIPIYNANYWEVKYTKNCWFPEQKSWVHSSTRFVISLSLFDQMMDVGKLHLASQAKDGGEADSKQSQSRVAANDATVAMTGHFFNVFNVAMRRVLKTEDIYTSSYVVATGARGFVFYHNRPYVMDSCSRGDKPGTGFL